MHPRHHLFWNGSIGRIAYWIFLVGYVMAFFWLLILFPNFLTVIPFAYLFLCLLANRCRNAGLPASLATLPILLISMTFGLYIMTSILTLGSGGSGTGGSRTMNQLHHHVENLPKPIFCFIGGLTLIAGLLPPRASRRYFSAETLETASA